MRSLRARIERLSRHAATEDEAGRLITVIAWGDSHDTIRCSRLAVSLVVPWTEALDRGGVEEAMAALTAEQRALIRPQDKAVILPYPPGGDPPRIETCGL
jgi:hypothetical protein